MVIGSSYFKEEQMKKAEIVLISIMMLLMWSSAVADSSGTEPVVEKQELRVEIQGKEEIFAYAGSTPGMSGTVYNFNSKEYSLSFIFNKKIKTGEEMNRNAFQQIEVISSNPATAGYYFVKKTIGKDNESKLLLEVQEKAKLKGEFSFIIHPADRWVGDLRPGMIENLEFKNGSFDFVP